MSVEFQLFGNLTIRQFAYIGVGGVIAFLLLIAPIPGLIKWPFILIIGAFFTSLAFLPINDIGLDRWFVAFLRAVNSPTKRVWRKEIKEISVFANDYVQRIRQQAENPPPASDRTKLDEYLATLRNSEPQSELDRAEEAYINSLPYDLGGAAPTIKPPILAGQGATASLIQEARTIEEDLTQPVPLQPTIKPVITVHMPDKNIYVKKVSTTTVNRQLHSLSSLEGTVVLPIRGEKTFEPTAELLSVLPATESAIVDTASLGLPPSPPPPPPVIQQAPPTAPIPPVPAPPPPTTNPQEAIVQPINERNPDGNQPFINLAEMETRLAAEAEAARVQLVKNLQSQKQAPTPSVPSPPQVAPSPEPSKQPSIETPPVVTTPNPTQQPPKPTPTRPMPALKKEVHTKPPTIKAMPAIGKMAPSPANVPNVVVGLIRDKNGMLLTDAVVIVKDPEDEPVRALKSNKVGQFAISTPLPSGSYTIDFEKDGCSFDTISVDLDGKIFLPIEIRSH